MGRDLHEGKSIPSMTDSATDPTTYGQLVNQNKSVATGTGQPPERAFRRGLPLPPTDRVDAPFVTLQHLNALPLVLLHALPYAHGEIVRARREEAAVRRERE